MFYPPYLGIIAFYTVSAPDNLNQSNQFRSSFYGNDVIHAHFIFECSNHRFTIIPIA